MRVNNVLPHTLTRAYHCFHAIIQAYTKTTVLPDTNELCSNQVKCIIKPKYSLHPEATRLQRNCQCPLFETEAQYKQGNWVMHRAQQFRQALCLRILRICVVGNATNVHNPLHILFTPIRIDSFPCTRKFGTKVLPLCLVGFQFPRWPHPRNSVAWASSVAWRGRR